MSITQNTRHNAQSDTSDTSVRGGSSVALRDIRKSLGGSTIVHKLSFDVQPSEFLTLLGPSGCGKTTTLNMVAGFISPDSGSIILDDEEVTSEPPNKRDSTMVFQQYALFPHLTIGENIAYGLKNRKVPASEIRKRVDGALQRVGLDGQEDRYPKQLSGGQQQRVALARAIVVEPKVLLLDEPLSNLDLKLREQLRLEIKHLQRDLGLTTIFVTHDQTEALVMSDRIAVMRDGRIEQLGTPAEIYNSPSNEFVAGFVGQSNLVDAKFLRRDGDRCIVELNDGTQVSVRISAEPTPTSDTPIRVLFRPESLHLIDTTEDASSPSIDGHALEVVNEGDNATVEVEISGGKTITVRVPDPSGTVLPDPGDSVRVAIPSETGLALLT